MLIIRAFVLLVVLCLSMAHAQNAPVTDDDPLVGSEAETPSESAPAQAQVGQAQQILVIGDNLAGGLGAGLLRLSETGTPIAVTNRFNEVSGLARPDFYDWPQAIAKLTEGKQFNSAIVLIGVNDRREFRSSQGRFAFGTPEWQQAYGAQIDAVVAALKARNIATYWVGLPPMADTNFDQAVQQMNLLAKTRVEAAGARFVDVRAQLLNPDGTYTDRALDEGGVERRIRSRDGITFMKVGNTRFASLVLKAIGGAPALAGDVTAQVPQIEADTPPPNTGPLMGETGNSGEEIVTDAREIKVVNAQKAAEVATKSPDPNNPIQDVFKAPPNTFADRLFTNGEPPVAPPGRFDDFTVLQQ